MQTRRIDQRFVFTIAENFTKAQRNPTLAFFDDKDRHVKHYQHDDNYRNNRFTHRYSP
ncbi:Uncharacterised protein [Raoultella planticola]|uniref:Uncharacterized protein n=1 Tax=Raoultella planticola TaxID=575 RepID=A0A485AN66_RAOPL|nr:Uncharacterised protein [Raoultella planticola]